MKKIPPPMEEFSLFMEAVLWELRERSREDAAHMHMLQ